MSKVMRPGTVSASAKRPQPKGGSRKGIPNKINGDVKAMILEALEVAGGVEYLVERAHDPKTSTAFLSLIGKVLPLQIVANIDVQLEAKQQAEQFVASLTPEQKRAAAGLRLIGNGAPQREP